MIEAFLLLIAISFMILLLIAASQNVAENSENRLGIFSYKQDKKEATVNNFTGRNSDA